MKIEPYFIGESKKKNYSNERNDRNNNPHHLKSWQKHAHNNNKRNNKRRNKHYEYYSVQNTYLIKCCERYAKCCAENQQ